MWQKIASFFQSWFSPSRISPEMGSTNQAPSKFPVGTLTFWALGDRVLIEEDQFRSGYECTKCGGSGKTACDNCGGSQVTTTGKKCGLCSDGSTVCSGCGGKGGLIVTPETSQRRPTSGTVVSAGVKCEYLKEGDSVLFSNFAGFVVDLARAGSPVTLRILHETEILAGMDGHLTLTNLRGKSEIAAFTS
jgi:co-chaperonin GroES (HSP10)